METTEQTVRLSDQAMLAAVSERDAEHDRNFEALERVLPDLMPEHGGEFALMKSGSIVGFYLNPGDALRDGIARFPDRLFSIQLLAKQPIFVSGSSYA